MDEHAYSYLPVNTTFVEFVIQRERPTSVNTVWFVMLCATETSIRRGGGGERLIIHSDFVIGHLLGSRTGKCHT